MQILHLEDSAFDAELIGETLRSCWPECQVTVASNRAEFERAVEQGHFDLVLSDFSMPGYNGLSALAFTRAHWPEKPFIYLSGTIGEERAVAALKAGATDYIVKDRPARLIPAISAALLQAEQTHARQSAEEKIREQASLLDKAREAIYVIDAEGTVTYWNASAERLYGWKAEEAGGGDLREMLYHEDVARFNTAYGLTIAAGEWRGELSPRPRCGEPVLVESSWTLVSDSAGEAKSILIVEADITERRKMENQLQQAQRLETLGLLVGGIAHDLNNVLAPIITSTSILKDAVTRPDDRELLDILDLSAHHGVDMVRQLLAFARGGEQKHNETAIDALVGSVCRLLQRAVPLNVAVRSSLASNLSPVHADATQLRQVLLNLCLNARDALPQGGVIEMRAEDVDVDDATHCVQGEKKPGHYVRISVADNGTGMPPTIAKKIFDPFFTTKGAGKGTGLGLANVVAIVKTHRGFLDLATTPDAGTTFHVYLPALARAAEPRTPGTVEGQGERVLIVEDDDDIRTILDVILSTRGYQVTMAASSEEGLDKLHRGEIFDVVMTDLNLAGKSGLEVIQFVRALPVAPKLIVFSGTSPEWHEESEELDAVAFLRKPFTTEGLLGTLRRVVDS